MIFDDKSLKMKEKYVNIHENDSLVKIRIILISTRIILILVKIRIILISMKIILILIKMSNIIASVMITKFRIFLKNIEMLKTISMLMNMSL